MWAQGEVLLQSASSSSGAVEHSSQEGSKKQGWVFRGEKNSEVK